ncbi:hypothetical protein J3R83DRAFT_3023 [Lanmaoa asiatica]|nr:hypothetical protein J3R83DRAFT_3023 [Lanmaoa asiatica]
MVCLSLADIHIMDCHGCEMGDNVHLCKWPSCAREIKTPIKDAERSRILICDPTVHHPVASASAPNHRTHGNNRWHAIPLPSVRPPSWLTPRTPSNVKLPGGTTSLTPVSPRSPSPQQSAQRSSSRQGSIRASPVPGPLIKDVPHLAPHSTFPPQSHQPVTGDKDKASRTHPQQRHSRVQECNAKDRTTASINSHLRACTRARMRRTFRVTIPVTITLALRITLSTIALSPGLQPVYGHGSSATLNASRNSLNGGVPSQRNHHTSPPPRMSTSQSPGLGPTHMPSGPPQRSRSHVRVSLFGTHETTATAQSFHKMNEPPPSPSAPTPAANELHRTTQRPALPANYDGQMETRYVNMLLALDDISLLFKVLASFFTWILLAGFLLFPGTFASWKTEPAGSPQSDILNVVNNVSLYVIAWICTGIGVCGMTWLWWRWQNNYIWVNNRIFIPGCLNSLAGVVSTLSNIFGTQAGVFGKSETSTIIITGVLSLICGILVLVYEFWLIRNLKLEHDQEVGVEMAGKHGEGVLGEKREGRNRGV